jgi:hypothetical protein
MSAGCIAGNSDNGRPKMDPKNLEKVRPLGRVDGAPARAAAHKRRT